MVHSAIFNGHFDGAVSPPAKICPVVEINDNAYVVMMHMMAGIPVKELGERVADLASARAALRDAIDFMINGYQSTVPGALLNSLTPRWQRLTPH